MGPHVIVDSIRHCVEPASEMAHASCVLGGIKKIDVCM